VFRSYDVLDVIRSAKRQVTGLDKVRSRIELSSGNLLARLGAGVGLVQVFIQRGGCWGYLILVVAITFPQNDTFYSDKFINKRLSSNVYFPRNLNVHCRIHSIMPMDSILNHLHQVQRLTPHLRFILILSSNQCLWSL